MGLISWIADQPFDFALVVAFARSAKPILEQVMRLQLGEHARPLSFAVPEDAGHGDLLARASLSRDYGLNNGHAPAAGDRPTV